MNAVQQELLYASKKMRIYCRPECRGVQRIKPHNLVSFRSIDEARSRGYRPCKLCRPEGSGNPVAHIFMDRYESPLGSYLLLSSNQGVLAVEPADQGMKSVFRRHPEWSEELQENGVHNKSLAEELDQYFKGTLRQFTVPLELKGTSFQLRVWELLNNISYGETRSYGELASLLGRPGAARAVGRAVGTNPISIVVPCHRVIGNNGHLTGYAGGMKRKIALLELERKKVED